MPHISEVIEPGSPWENGCIGSFNARFSDELRSGEIFYTLRTARRVVWESCRHDNTVRPHSAPGWRSPAPEASVPMDPRRSCN